MQRRFTRGRSRSTVFRPVHCEPLETRRLLSAQADVTQLTALRADPNFAGIDGSGVGVAVIDSGVFASHPDLVGNFVGWFDAVRQPATAAASTDPAAAFDPNGHGTHTAGTIAAASNGIGIVGVAPNVKIAGIKAGNADGFFFPEAVVCAFMWAGSHHIPVTNNSYFADPWLFNCKNDPGQRAIWTAERRAIQYAMSNGTTEIGRASCRERV